MYIDLFILIAGTFQIKTEFLPKLLNHIQNYFIDKIQLIVFGSTETNLAFHDSDVDLCFSFEQSKVENSNGDGSGISNSTMDIMAQNISDLHVSKIHSSVFNQLPKPGISSFLCLLHSIQIGSSS